MFSNDLVSKFQLSIYCYSALSQYKMYDWSPNQTKS